MPRPPSPSIPEKEFVYGALKQSLRLDGRAMLEMRTPTLTFGPELGWVECAMGKTRYALSLVLLISHTSLTVCIYSSSSRFQSTSTSGREDGEAPSRTAARGDHLDPFGALPYGI